MDLGRSQLVHRRVAHHYKYSLSTLSDSNTHTHTYARVHTHTQSQTHILSTCLNHAFPRQTDRFTEGQIDRQVYGRSDRPTNRWTEFQTDRYTEKSISQAGRQTDGRTDIIFFNWLLDREYLNFKLSQWIPTLTTLSPIFHMISHPPITLMQVPWSTEGPLEWGRLMVEQSLIILCLRIQIEPLLTSGKSNIARNTEKH